MQEQTEPSLRVFTVWEPVLPTDFGTPSTMTLRRLSDPRVSQYWDKGHLISHLLGEHDDASAIWDYVAVYEPGTMWEQSPPAPAYSHVPVVDGIGGARDALRQLLHKAD